MHDTLNDRTRNSQHSVAVCKIDHSGFVITLTPQPGGQRGQNEKTQMDSCFDSLPRQRDPDLVAASVKPA